MSYAVVMGFFPYSLSTSKTLEINPMQQDFGDQSLILYKSAVIKIVLEWKLFASAPFYFG